MYNARNADLVRFERTHGIVLPDVEDFYSRDLPLGNFDLAMDAQPALITVSNAGIPSWLSTFIDPRLITVLLAPNKAAQIYDEVKKGDWTLLTAVFPIVEHTGETSSYGDWNNNGEVNANVNFPQRQSYHYQTITQWGERQLDMAALAKIDWAARLNIASVIVLNKFQNKSYLFGIGGLQNYGILNDPGLTAALTPGTKAAGGVKWITSSGVINGTANEIFADIQSMFYQLVLQAKGLIDATTRMKLVTSPESAVALTATNTFNVNVYDLLKKNFPNITFETVPEFNTAAGETVQLIAAEVEGQETGIVAFTEKLRAHTIVKEMSAFRQKKSQGTWGGILFQPFAVAQMVGV